METLRHSYLSRSHLLTMAMFAQEAVDYSIKSYELGTPEIHRLFWKYDQEWLNLNRSIADRGRTLIAAGTLVVDGSQKADSALRIFSALQVTYKAAAEIAHSAALMLELERRPASPQLGELGHFVNGLVRLCTVALFKKEVRHANRVLFDYRGRHQFKMTLCRTLYDLIRKKEAQARLELAIAGALEQIAEQAYEIAQALAPKLLEHENHRGTACVTCFAA
jgi:hypothetical protein